ncbi:MAG: hypothetical protein WCA32_18065 [Chromatiaceae bacterium]
MKDLYAPALETFTICVWCDACGHRGIVDRAKIPESIPMRKLHDNLRRSACGSHQTSIPIVYTGAGGFQYGTSERSR